MTPFTFDALTRQLGRRRILQALGVAAVATTSGVVLTDAKHGRNTNGKARKNRKDKAKQLQRIDEQSLALCAGEVEECNALIVAQCDNEAECVSRGQACCAVLATCDLGGLFACLSKPV
jgi:hypothetical protein